MTNPAPSGAPATTSDSPAAAVDPYRPAEVFISYASEDLDIAQAVYQSLQAVGETIFDRIRVFLDSKSIDGGDQIRADIKAHLRKSDFLLVLYTGMFKRSHGYTGFEVGFFEALIDEDISKSGQTARKIVYFYCDELPPTSEGILGISMNVDGGDLGGSRADYVQKCAQSPDNPDQLARFFIQVADRAETRLPPQLQDPDALVRRRRKREERLATEIIPNLKGKLFDSMSKRVTLNSTEQKLIEFDLAKPASDQMYITLPDDARLTQHSGAFEIFDISRQADMMTWGAFCKDVRSHDPQGGASVLLAIEQAVVSAISPAIRVDNDQIIKSSANQIYRVLVTRQLDYYNGRKVVHVYFIQKLQITPLGNNDTSTILGFINLAAKYRFIFIERESPLSVESFIFTANNAEIQNKVRQLVRELLLIEDESRKLHLDKVGAISVYFGGDPAHLDTAKALQTKWFRARRDLMAAAEKILRIPPDQEAFQAANEEWLATLRLFRQMSGEMNATVAVQALEKLKKSFLAGTSDSAAQP